MFSQSTARLARISAPHSVALGILCLLASVAHLNAAPPEITLRAVFQNINFSLPVQLTSARDGSGRIFVVQKRGTIVLIRDGAASTFLDVTGRVNSGPNEAGLLSVAFHPDYAQNGRFYVNYTAGDLDTRISEFTVSAGDPDIADPTSERILLTIDQPFGNHNGGQIAFGPDSMLYIGMGDGGSARDPRGHGQNRATLLGAMLRIDVDRQDEGLEYAIPLDNPFIDNQAGWREEIWAWGLRNPWRFSFDRGTGELWVGDVGQDRYEEVAIVRRGENHGWKIMEGAHCHSPSTGCDTTGLTLPVKEFPQPLFQSITGGFVYRGGKFPTLRGYYFTSDFVTGRIWALRYENGALIEDFEALDTSKNWSAFGEDEEGELYIIDYNGQIYAIEAKTASGVEDNPKAPLDFGLRAYPNPAASGTGIRFVFTMPSPASVELAVFDVRGRKVATLVDGTLPGGEHKIRWPAVGVGAGVYFYRIRINGKMATEGKVALL